MINDLLQRWWFGRDCPVGIQLSETEIIATFRSRVHAADRIHSVSRPMPKGGFDGGVVLKEDEVGIAIRKMLSDSNHLFDRCGVALEPAAYFMKRIAPPQSLLGSGDATVTAWALEFFRFDPADVSGQIRWCGEGTHALFVGVKRHILESFQNTMSWAQLDLDIITLRPMVLHWLVKKRWRSSPTAPYVLIDARGDRGEVYQIDRDEACVRVSSFCSINELSEVIARVLLRELHNLCLSEIDDQSNPAIVICLEGSAPSLTEDMAKAVHTCADNYGLALSTSFITPATDGISLVSEALAAFMEERDSD